MRPNWEAFQDSNAPLIEQKHKANIILVVTLLKIFPSLERKKINFQLQTINLQTKNWKEN